MFISIKHTCPLITLNQYVWNLIDLIDIIGRPTLSGEIREEDFAEGLDLVVKSFDALDLGGVFRTFFGVDVVLAALEPDLIMKHFTKWRQLSVFLNDMVFNG